jgi:hypothetical protein
MLVVLQVTLQKERVPNVENRTSSTEQLNHPLYRSQSLDALQRISRRDRDKDSTAAPAFRAKRTQSEMKSDTRGPRDSPRKGDKGDKKHAKLGSPSPSSASSSSHGHRSPFRFSSDVQVHSPDAKIEAVKKLTTEASPTKSRGGGSPDRGGSPGRLDTETARDFANMMDQVLDGREKGDGSVPTSPKTPPNKPQRKKKPSGSSLEDIGGEVEEVLKAASAVTAHAAPPRLAYDNEGDEEVEEEQIQPEFVKREVIINSDIIEFAPVEPQSEPSERSESPDGFIHVNLSDGQDGNVRPASPEGDPVEEEVIEASVADRDVQAAPLPSAAKKDKGDKRKKEKEKPKAPAFNEAELERLIAMNTFAPGTQGLVGIQKGGTAGGIMDDFVPRDLHNGRQGVTARSSSSSSDASSTGRGRGQVKVPRGGVAFEVRDDVLTGRPVSVDLTSRSRNTSLSPSRSNNSLSPARSSDSGSRDRMGRASSLRDEHTHHHHDQRFVEDKENSVDSGLDWSGKRLVRSGSFSEIPQDTSLMPDWTDKNRVQDDEDDVSTASGSKRSAGDNTPNPAESEDSEAELVPRALPARDVFKARENLTSMSDVSNSFSSSRSSSPPLTNGPGVEVSVGSSHGSGVKSSAGSRQASIDVPADSNANSKMAVSSSVSVTLAAQDDMDC